MKDDDRPVIGFAGLSHAAATLAPAAGSLPVADFAALHGVGITPLGPVVVAYAMNLAGNRFVCGTTSTAMRHVDEEETQIFEPLELLEALESARAVVLARLEEHAVALGADGVLGVQVEQHIERTAPWGPSGVAALVGLVVRLRMTGTAVRGLASGSGHRPSPRPRADPRLCLTASTGVEVGLLRRSGLVPSGLGWGFGVSMWHGRAGAPGVAASLWGGPGARNGVLPELTALLRVARGRARDDLAAQLGAADQVTVAPALISTFDMELTSYHRHAFAVATLVGSAAIGSVAPADPLPVLMLR